MENSSSQSIHFRLVNLGDGVYAALAEPKGSAVSNAGIVDTGENTLVFDTFLTPRAATDLRAMAETMTHRGVTYVINSHWHNDHIRGNQSFPPETEIISTRTTRGLIETRGVIEAQDDWESISVRSKGGEPASAQDSPLFKREELFSFSGYNRQLAEMTQRLKLRTPTWVFDGKMSFHGPRQTVELYDLGAAHSENDLVMYLPGPKILFASDLVIVESHPYLGDADPQGWLRVLDWIESLSPLIVVPGHGPVAGAESIGQIRAYIHHILDRSKRIAGEKDLEEASARMEIPAEYTGWGHAKLYAANLSSLARRHTSKRD